MAIRCHPYHLVTLGLLVIVLAFIPVEAKPIDSRLSLKDRSNRIRLQGTVQSILSVTVESDGRNNIDLLSASDVSEDEAASIVWEDSSSHQTATSTSPTVTSEYTVVRKVFQLGVFSNTGVAQKISLSSTDHYFESSSGQRVPYIVGINLATNAVYVRYNPADFSPHENYHTKIALTITGDSP
ncbi:hypothetical protein XM38_022930 [Halomicronema hongdechloris C2206]|uniref:Uncharacterized protein n=1 Tax=Halomicronema hongdechloris C2206 TaxID=1641165 RepID=A0A1Z3HM10_9CYAN|nr:hypothetical protein [Halomicronema hongdechloris]ASC71341.1 hypothetical protein XM38_022930 [Halomicronema hongdechloris C2206]